MTAIIELRNLVKRYGLGGHMNTNPLAILGVILLVAMAEPASLPFH